MAAPKTVLQKRSVFISYARKDAREMALRLRDLLTAAGYTVWLDTAQIEGGASWSLEIETAIDHCDALLAVLTPASYRSEVCRGEHLRALRKGKRVLPLLGERDAERPVYLEHLHYLDFSDFRAVGGTEQTAFNTAFTALQNELSGGEAIPLPAQYRTTRTLTLPSLPDTFTPRADVLDTLRARVLNDESDRHVALTALRGMGGIGKTVMALALAHDQAVQDAFPDGIAWIKVGKTPEAGVVGIIQSTFSALGEPPLIDTQKQTCINRLRAMMQEKSILFILDDVWSAEYIEPFLASAPLCRVVVTTRGLGVANLRDEYEIAEVMLGTMHPAEAHELLARHIGKQDAAIPRIAERVGYLPLALKLVGSRLNPKNNLRKMTGDQWLSTFKRAAELRTVGGKQDASTSLDLCIGLSVDELDSANRRLYHTLGIFAEDVEIPRIAAAKLWVGLNPVITDNQVDELIVMLDQLALIQLDPASGAFTIHDLLHDFNQGVLSTAGTLEVTHRAFLAAYNPDNQPWAEVADTYLCEYLAYHLNALHDRDSLYHLLTDSATWMDCCAAQLGSEATYAADLSELIAEYSDPVQPDQAAGLVTLHTAQAVVSTRASVFDDVDLGLLAKLGHVDEAVTRAKLRPDAKARFDGLLFLWQEMARAGANDDEPDDIDPDSPVAVVSPVAFPVALAELEELATHIIDRDARSSAFGRLAAAYATDRQPDHALALLATMISTGGDIPTRIDSLIRAANAFIDVEDMPHARALLEQALPLSDQITRQTVRLNTIKLIAAAYQRLGDHTHAVALLESTTAWAEMRGDTLGILAAAYALIEEYGTAIEMVARLDSVFSVAYTIRAIAASLSRYIDRGDAAELFKQALILTAGVQDEKARSEIYGIIASAQGHAGFPDEALQTVGLITKSYFLDYALRNITSALAKQGDFVRARDTLEKIVVPRGRSEALRKLAGGLFRAGHKTEAVEAVLGAINEAYTVAHNVTQIDLARRAIKRLVEMGALEIAAEQFERYRDAQSSVEENDGNRAEQVIQATAVCFARYGDPASALHIIRRIRNESLRANTTREINSVAAHPGRKPHINQEREPTPDNLNDWLAYARGKAPFPTRTGLSDKRESSETKSVTTALRAAVSALARANHIEESVALLLQVQERRAYYSASGTVCSVLARSGQIKRALDLLQAQDIERLLLFIVNSVVPPLEEQQPGSGLIALREALRIAGWARRIYVGAGNVVSTGS